MGSVIPEIGIFSTVQFFPYLHSQDLGEKQLGFIITPACPRRKWYCGLPLFLTFAGLDSRAIEASELRDDSIILLLFRARMAASGKIYHIMELLCGMI